MPEPGMGGDKDTRSGSGNERGPGNPGDQAGQTGVGRGPGGEDRGVGDSRVRSEDRDAAQAKKDKKADRNKADRDARKAAASNVKQPSERQKAFGTKARQVVTVDPNKKTTTTPTPMTDRQSLAVSAVEALGPKGPVDLDPAFDEDGNLVNQASLPDELAGAPVGGPLTQSEFEKVMGITDVDPIGTGNMSTGLGRGMKKGLSSLSDFLSGVLGRPVNLKTSYPDMSQTKRDFLRNTAYEKYLDPFGQGKVLTTMKNYNLTEEEQAAYDAAAKAQGTSKPMQVMTEQEYAQDLAARGGDIDPSKYAPKANTIRSGLRPGDLTQYGPVESRPRNIGPMEMGMRGAFAASPIGPALGILSAVTDMDRVKGIRGFPDPVTGQPFQPAPDKSIFQQGIDLFTGGVGSTALSQANQAAQNLISGQGIFNTTAAQSLPDVTGRPVNYTLPTPTEQNIGTVDIGVGSDTKITDLTQPSSFLDYFSSQGLGNNRFGGGGGRDDQILLPTDLDTDDVQDDTNTTQPMNNLFAQEMYGGLQGPFVVPPLNFGISGLPTSQTNRPAKFTV